jgi:hypothetical protein
MCRFALPLVAVATGRPPPARAADPTSCPLATDGTSLQRVVVSSQMSERTRAAAKNLATYLRRITRTPASRAQDVGPTPERVLYPDNPVMYLFV